MTAPGREYQPRRDRQRSHARPDGLSRWGVAAHSTINHVQRKGHVMTATMLSGNLAASIAAAREHANVESDLANQSLAEGVPGSGDYNASLTARHDHPRRYSHVDTHD
jgi:hypothetical protein